MNQIGGHLRTLDLPDGGWINRHLPKGSDVERILPRVLAGQRVPYDTQWVDSHGVRHTYKGVAEPWYDARGEITGALYVALDVTCE